MGDPSSTKRDTVKLQADWSLSDVNRRMLFAIEVALSQSEREAEEKARKWFAKSKTIRAVVVVNFNESQAYAGPTVAQWRALRRPLYDFHEGLDNAVMGEEINIFGYRWFGRCEKVDVTVFYRLGWFGTHRPPKLSPTRFQPRTEGQAFTPPVDPLECVPYSDSPTGRGEPVRHEEMLVAKGSFGMTEGSGAGDMADVDAALVNVFRVISLCCSNSDDAGFRVDWGLVRTKAWEGALEFAEERWRAEPRKS